MRISAPDTHPIPTDGKCCLFHRYIEADILFHGCSPLMLGPASSREPVLHLIGEQPPSKIRI